MQNIKNFRKVEPTTEQIMSYASQDNGDLLFLSSEDGQDWYECQTLFADGTIKIMYDAQGVIRSMVTEPVPQRGNVLPVSMFWPVDCSVAEVNALPEACDISGAWRYTDSGEIVRHHDFDLKLAEKILLSRLNEADSMISPLERAVKHGIETNDERAVLEAWERYSVLLSRVDTSTAPDIDWPPIPA
ncbi:hypothetical protein A6V27_19575 [Hafnia alvei]|uniref:tail fiber assembly protein n=1 Tax=Hafnia alvei TaxID=569 RepID=UPI0007BCCE1B|nr:tail fiber assembly protein [Hafnia alvei]ANC42413.1 hypothetical protein A6V27_19575 [Hafnia alvei]